MEQETITMTPEAQQHVLHSLEAFGATIKSLNDAGMEPAAVATALGSVTVNFVTVMAALLGIPQETVMPKLLESIESLKEYSDKVYEGVTAEYAKKAANEQQ